MQVTPLDPRFPENHIFVCNLLVDKRPQFSWATGFLWEVWLVTDCSTVSSTDNTSIDLLMKPEGPCNLANVTSLMTGEPGH